jgi:hypothetical protein
VDAEPVAGAFAADQSMTGGDKDVDGAAEDEPDAEPAAGMRAVVVLVVVITAGS